jgi:phage regulator Rha-like protein
MSNQSSLIKLQQVGFELRVDSRVLADLLGIQHKNVIALLTKYRDDFEEFGFIAFQTRKIKKGRPLKFALLNRSQSELLLTYSDNSFESRKLKIALIKAFDKARSSLEANSSYIPFYHAAHESLQALIDKSGSSVSPATHHMNLERLINKHFGLKAGTRNEQPSEIKLMIGAAMALSDRIYKQALANGQNHKQGYRRVKEALEHHLYLTPAQLRGAA